MKKVFLPLAIAATLLAAPAAFAQQPGAKKTNPGTEKAAAPIKGAGANDNNVNVTGDLTIKGITKPVTFPAKVGVKNGVAAASGTAVVDRTKYDIRYGSKSFFEGIGDKAIDNDFSLTFNVIAK
jgi:hypothetical protein